MVEDPAVLTFEMSSAPTLSRSSEMAPEGFATKSTAPSWRHRIVASAPAFVSEETMMTAVGFSNMIAFRASKPSIPGISTSSVTTSGDWARVMLKASAPFLACPTTVISGSESRIVVINRRMKALSSTTKTLSGGLKAKQLPSDWRAWSRRRQWL